ncbi:hypothetical protein [Endozoicomonas euniceicola]|uniref:Uncharacterized protein n=1 Tax=Endozoicomonas euniceicola TaxID=1234143 RepID=A0ABY6GXD7_9GAMM|nr:hypothetical protein [Endozoicomonas euniceicola]UYM17448.1 hypothetical protein NX720_05880 [Endozoicomonas euniceicola]
MRLALALTLLIQANLSYPACTSLLSLFDSRLASAATGQVISQHSLLMPDALTAKLFKYGVFIGVLDSMRVTISKLLECPVQNTHEVTLSMAMPTVRTIISGLIHSYLLENYYHLIDPVIYSGLYAAADTLLTGSSKTTNYDHDSANTSYISYLGSRINNALWQCSLAMALNVAGRAVASRLPTHKHAANLVTQLTLIYGTALAYITYAELKNSVY